MHRACHVLLFLTCLCMQKLPAVEAQENEVLISGRMEMISLLNFTEPIRQDTKANSRFYFNNIFLNIEGDLGARSSFIVEFQPLTSDLYLLGGFLTIADALQGLGLDEPTPRKIQIAGAINRKLDELDKASESPTLERASIRFFFGDGLGLSLGRVRNPFGFWDDYSIFRNLSALKTDPVTLGVALRRTDQGALFFGQRGRYNWHVGILEGSNTLHQRDVDDDKDLVARLGVRWGDLDLATSGYIHNAGSAQTNRALGLSYRWRAGYHLTVLGEIIEMENGELDLETEGYYVQATYDLSDHLLEGLRWNMFFENYDSSLLDIDLEPSLDYRFAGTYFQASTGFVYAYNRHIDLGAKVLTGRDEEGDAFYKVAAKIDARF
jgi:hypothetical protein